MKGSDLARHFARLPPEERRHLPALRFKPDLEVEHEEARRVLARILQDVSGGRLRSILIADEEAGVRGVMIPEDRYVELLATELVSSSDWVVLTDGRLVPAGLEESELEQVDPAEAWAWVHGAV